MRASLLVLVLLAGCAPRTVERRDRLKVQPLAAASQSGWARVVLDREAQAAFPDVWLGDAAGTSIPFLVERDGLWDSQALEVRRLVTGLDRSGFPSASFRLMGPAGWEVRDREQLQVELDVEGEAPWACRVNAELLLPGGGINLSRDLTDLVYDFGPSGHRLTLEVPWEVDAYTLHLEPVQGKAPRIRGVKVWATSDPSTRKEDTHVVPRVQDQGQGNYLLVLDGPDRVVGADVDLKPPVAPVRPTFLVPEREQGAGSQPMSSESLVWNLPALKSTANRVRFTPVTTDRLLMSLPEGAVPASVRLRVRRDVLLFPAEAGKRYGLHHGGRVKAAPGSLQALPNSSRGLFERQPLALAAGEPDGMGIPVVDVGPRPVLAWLPWVTGLLVLGLSYLGLRLLRGGSDRS